MVAVICVVLLLAALRAPAKRRWPYLVGTLTSALLVVFVTPFVEVIGSHPLWIGPTIPVLGRLDVTREELANGLFQGCASRRSVSPSRSTRCGSTTTGCSRRAGWARRSTVAVALATRLLPVLERDARDLRLALRGRRAEFGPMRLLSPLVAGSLERGLNVAEAMEARGYGRPAARARRGPAGRALDRLAVAGVGADRGGGMAGSSRRRRTCGSPTHRVARCSHGVSLDDRRRRAHRPPRPVRRRQVDAPARAGRARAALPRRRLRRAA